MNQADTEGRVRAAFLEVAPDVDLAQLQRDVPFKDQIDFDSMDTLNFAIRLHREFDIDVAESEYRQIGSLSGAVAFVSGKLASIGSG